jgi:hypothetical protein
VALLVPRFERLKEWAYAGAVFNFSGGSASHLLAGDRPGKLVAPLMLMAMACSSPKCHPFQKSLDFVDSPREHLMPPANWTGNPPQGGLTSVGNSPYIKDAMMRPSFRSVMLKSRSGSLSVANS